MRSGKAINLTYSPLCGCGRLVTCLKNDGGDVKWRQAFAVCLGLEIIHFIIHRFYHPLVSMQSHMSVVQINSRTFIYKEGVAKNGL